MIDADRLSAFVREHAEEICQHFFPLGKRDGHEWKIGDVSGKAGNSLGIEIEGDKAGLCNDRAGGFKGNLISLIGENRGLKYPLVAEEIGRAFGVSFSLNGAADFDWGKLERLNSANQRRLAKWRAFRPEFVGELVAHDLVRLFKDRGLLCWAFPIHAGGRIGGCHFRAIDIDESKRPDWHVYPTQKNGGPGMQPLVIGNLERALRAHICESTWDALVLCDSLGIGLGGASEDVLFCTRGAANGKFVDQIPQMTQTIYVWPQNDQPGQDWLRKVSETLDGPFYRVHVPAQHKDLNDWVRAGATSEELCDAIKTAEPVEPPQAPKTVEGAAAGDEDLRFKEILSNFESSICLSKDFPSIDIPTREVLLANWLKEGDLGFVYGYRGSGKTWFVDALAISLSSGRCLGDWEVPNAVNVLYIDGEMPPDDAQSRITGLDGLNEHLLILHHEVLFARRGAAINLADYDQQRAITELCIKRRVKVMILDNLSCLVFGVKENDSDEWEKMKHWLLDLRRRRIAVIIVHHAGTSGRMRGTTKREDDAFWVIRVQEIKKDGGDESEGAYFETIFEKQRNVSQALLLRKWSFKTEPDGTVLVVCDEVSFDEKVFNLIEAGLRSATDIALELNVAKSTTCKAAARLEKRKLIEIRSRQYFPRGFAVQK